MRHNLVFNGIERTDFLQSIIHLAVRYEFFHMLQAGPNALACKAVQKPGEQLSEELTRVVCIVWRDQHYLHGEVQLTQRRVRIFCLKNVVLEEELYIVQELERDFAVCLDDSAVDVVERPATAASKC